MHWKLALCKPPPRYMWCHHVYYIEGVGGVSWGEQDAFLWMLKWNDGQIPASTWSKSRFNRLNCRGVFDKLIIGRADVVLKTHTNPSLDSSFTFYSTSLVLRCSLKEKLHPLLERFQRCGVAQMFRCHIRSLTSTVSLWKTCNLIIFVLCNRWQKNGWCAAPTIWHRQC